MAIIKGYGNVNVDSCKAEHTDIGMANRESKSVIIVNPIKQRGVALGFIRKIRGDV